MTSRCEVVGPLLVGLTGRAGAGKDTAAAELVRRYGFARVALADPIREMVYELDPILGHGLTFRALVDDVGWEAAKRHRLHGPEVRRLLQVFGTEVGRRMICPTLWIVLAERQCLDMLAGGVSVVVSDIRFPDEADMVRRLGGTVVRVDRPDGVSGDGASNPELASTAGHASEAQTVDVCAELTLTNNSTLEAVAMASIVLVEQLRLQADSPKEAIPA